MAQSRAPRLPGRAAAGSIGVMDGKRGRLLGIDYGSVRLGLALSDRGRRLAQGLAVYHRRDLIRDFAYLKELIAQHQIAAIVLGLPLNMDGSLGAQARQVLHFKVQLEAELKLSIALFDERLSSAEAERVLLSAELRRRRRRGLRDQLAATLILQGYLDQDRHSGQL